MSSNPTVVIGGGSDVASLLKQFTANPEFLKGTLAPHAYRAAAVVLKNTLSNATPNAQATFRVPTTHNMMIWGMRGVIGLTDPNHADEVAMRYATLAATLPRDSDALLKQKAGLVTLDLQNQDLATKLIEGSSLPLSSILAMVGGEKIDWSRAPHPVQGGQTLLLDLGLAASAVADVGAAFEAGVMLDVTFVRCKEG